MIELKRLFLSICLTCMSCCQAQALEMWPRLRIVVDEAAYTPEQAWYKTQLDTAMQVQHAHQVLGPANSHAHWAAWSVHAAEFQHKPLWLSLQSPTQDHSDLWIRRGDGAWQFQADMNSLAKDWGEGYLMPTWLLTGKGADRLDLLLRISGPNRVQFPLAVHTPVQYVSRQQRIMLFMGAVLAVPLVVVMYAMCLIRGLNNPRLPLFVGMAVCELVAAMWVSGLLSLSWPTLTRQQAASLGSASYWMLFVLSIFHAQSFLNTHQSYPRAHRLLGAAAWLWLGVVPLCAWLFPEWLRALLIWGGSLHATGMVCLAWHRWRQTRSGSDIMYAGVWSVYLSSVLVYWMYRVLEWPLFTTLGVQFVQGAAVATLLGLSASLQVIQERHHLQQQLQLTKARARWHAAAQHDLWQPLQSIQLYVQAWLTAPKDQQPMLVNGLQLASHSVDDFMNHLRFFADGSSQATAIQARPISIQAVLTPLVEEFRPLAQMRHVLLRYRPSQAWVHIDERAVQRMVRNLLTNALQHTSGGGRVLLACQRRGDLLWLLCIDTGVGMSPDQAQACFNAFTKFEPHAPHVNKLGLGLFSVKQLALQHHMPTRLQSVQGQGTLVGFGMPLVSQK